ncbi:hypothetical protein [Variovorax sp. dw_954]|uniref:hypothetical protein n=1 Tax=Variovorax sp. dw_954 TaxID=2720078 RepID=UPI001BD66395|nr:hypothetical protein [Variovorax sp. dw_954]
MKSDIRAPDFDSMPSGALNDCHRPSTTRLAFPGIRRTFDFARWYGRKIDSVTWVCQRQIERFLARQDSELADQTILNICGDGLRVFLDYVAFRAADAQRSMTLADIDRELIDGFIAALSASGARKTTQKLWYQQAKALLLALGRNGLLEVTKHGDAATFPRNPFPNAGRSATGEDPLTHAERRAFAAAVKRAVLPLMTATEPTGELLAYALLAIALHTGRNTTPLLEMSVDCLVDHPKGDRMFLVLYKRRGRRVYKAALKKHVQWEATPHALPTAGMDIVRLIKHVIAITQRLREEAAPELRQRVWLYRFSRSLAKGSGTGDIITITDATLGKYARKLVEAYDLRNASGELIRLNISRLRKTFVNRVSELLDGDLALTAVAAGNTPKVTNVNYLRPGEHAERNWMFLGEALASELKTGTLGATHKTPVGGCSDTLHGQYAPDHGGAVCMNFLNCLRCRNYVVTGDDLYRLFSFYWRVLGERDRVDKRRWEKQLAHIPRLIERDVIQVGLDRGLFKQEAVDAARTRARTDPHPFWKSDLILNALDSLA